VPSLISGRESYTGPERLSPAWTLHKGKRSATCEVWSNEYGFELRAFVDGKPVLTSVCGTQHELIDVREEWRTAFEAKGWTKTP
jgi:hypothetical protein